ncbi:MAG: hypothetical protein IKR48_00585 [Kiritimatiellae bacterium]|nr:hypothetical protein [Kiritimatiellia bacterium]
MALTVTGIRNYIQNSTGDERILVDQQGGIATVNKMQRFKSFFNIGIARQQNGLTIDAIHRAIANDPQYFAPEVQAKAAELLSQIRTDRAIGVAQIRSIIDTLDTMTTPGKQLQGAQDMVAARLAADGLPDFAADCEHAYVKLASKTIFPAMPPGGYTSVNIGRELANFNQRMATLFNSFGGDPDGVALLAACINKGGLNAPDRSLTTDTAKINRIIGGIQANLTELHTIETQYGRDAKEAVLAFLKSYGKPMPPTTNDPAPLMRIATARHNLVVPTGLSRLSADSSVSDLHAAVMSLCESVATVKAGIVVDVEEENEVPKFFARCALEGMTPAQKQGILDALQSEGGRHLQSLYELNMSSNQTAHLADTILHEMVPLIRADLSLPDVNKPIVLPMDVDVTKLSPGILAKFNPYPVPTSMITGDADTPVKSLLERIEKSGTAHAQFDTLQDICHAMIVTNITSQISNDLFAETRDTEGKVIARTFDPDKTKTQFDLDLERGYKIFLPSGEQIPDDSVAARDKFVQFVTGNPQATFATADTPTKVKAMILTTCLNQSIPGTAMSAFGEYINDDPAESYAKVSMVSDNSIPRDEVFHLSKESNGDIMLHARMRRPVKALTVVGDSNLYMLGKGSYDEYEIEIKFPAANLDMLAHADWQTYDHAPVNSADHAYTSKTRHLDSANLVPDAFKFTGTVSMASHLHFVKAPDA